MNAIQWYSKLSYNEKIKIKRQLNITVSDSSLESNDIKKMYKKFKQGI